MDNGALPTRSKKKSFEELISNPYIIVPSPEELEEAKNVESDITIPSRVFCNFPIRIGKSTFAGAGRGTFAVKEIKAGNLIYKIDQTTITSVSYRIETFDVKVLERGTNSAYSSNQVILGSHVTIVLP